MSKTISISSCLKKEIWQVNHKHMITFIQNEKYYYILIIDLIIFSTIYKFY